MAIRFSSWILFTLFLLITCSHGGDEANVLKLHSMDHHDHEANHVHDHDHHHHHASSSSSSSSSSSHMDHGGDEANVLKLHSMDHHDHEANHVHDHDHHHHHASSSSSSHMDHIDPQVLVFFFLEDLKQGQNFTVYFPNKDTSTSPQFLPQNDADSIPFSLQALPSLLTRFHFAEGSPQAQAMRSTLTECQTEPIRTETKFCATSLESMLGFVRAMLGPYGAHFEALSTAHSGPPRVRLQNYAVSGEPVEVLAPKIVACHTMPYPYAVFYCHSQVTENRVFRVKLKGDNGDEVDAVAVCHMDTSLWTPDHVAFRVLRTHPGESHVCHFFPADNLVWVPSSA